MSVVLRVAYKGGKVVTITEDAAARHLLYLISTNGYDANAATTYVESLIKYRLPDNDWKLFEDMIKEV